MTDGGLMSLGMVLMEHPPKQGLKHSRLKRGYLFLTVLMEHPPKQGLKHSRLKRGYLFLTVLMEHPPKQGLKLAHAKEKDEGEVF